jgi:hypothetical protein
MKTPLKLMKGFFKLIIVVKAALITIWLLLSG